ncbi:MAG: DUF5519 family protein [Actinomycetia bacterium]|nr:DUF5519 family protein [Actinomycetes bacterium]
MVGNPQQQLDQQSTDPSLRRELAERVFALPEVSEEPSRISVLGARAQVLSEAAAVGPPEALLIGREFAHLHPERDQSLHLSLPEEEADAAIESGWAELHPWSREGRIPPTRLLVCAPRDRGELEVVHSLVLDSYCFASSPPVSV